MKRIIFLLLIAWPCYAGNIHNGLTITYAVGDTDSVAITMSDQVIRFMTIASPYIVNTSTRKGYSWSFSNLSGVFYKFDADGGNDSLYIRVNGDTAIVIDDTDISIGNGYQIYGQTELWMKTIVFTDPATLPTDTLWFYDNFTGSTITIDSIKIEHDDTGTPDLNLYYKWFERSDGTTRFKIDDMDDIPNTWTERTISRPTIVNKRTIGIGELTGGNGDATYIKVTLIGQIIRAKLAPPGELIS